MGANLFFSSSFSPFNQMEIHYDILAHGETIVNAWPSAVREWNKNKRMLYGRWENQQLFFSTRKRLCKTNLPLPLRVTPGCRPSSTSILVGCRVLTAAFINKRSEWIERKKWRTKHLLFIFFLPLSGNLRPSRRKNRNQAISTSC